MTSVRSWILVALAAALFLTMTGLAWVFRAPIATAAARQALAAAGVEGELVVEEVGFSQIRVTGLRIGSEARPAVRANVVRLGYGLADIFALRARSVRVDGLVVNAELQEAGLGLVGLPMATAGSERGGGGRLPERIEAEDAVITIATPAGTLTADLDLVGGAAGGWRLEAAVRPARIAQDDRVLDLAAAAVNATINEDGAEIDAELSVSELVGRAWRADDVDLELRFTGEAMDLADLTTIEGAGALALSAEGAGVDAETAARLAAFAPQIRGEAGVFVSPHVEVLRELLVEALQGFDARAELLLASGDGQLILAPDGDLELSAESGLTLTLGAGDPPVADAASFLSVDPEAGRVEAQALRASMSGAGAPSVTLDVTRAAYEAEDGGALRVVGGMDLADWRVDGFAVGLELSAAALDWTPQSWRIEPKGVLRLDGQRGDFRVRAGRADFDAVVAWAEGRVTLDWRASADEGSRDPAPFVLAAASAAYGDAEFGRLRVRTPWPDAREGRPPVFAADSGAANAEFQFTESLVTAIAAGGSVTAELPAGYVRLDTGDAGEPILSVFVQGLRASGATDPTEDLRAEARTLEVETTLSPEPQARVLVTRLSAEAAAWPIVLDEASADLQATFRDGRPYDGRFGIAATVCEPSASNVAAGRDLEPCDDPPTLAPLVISAEADIVEGVAEGEASLAFETPALDALGGSLDLGAARYRFDLTNGSGEASLASTRLSFAPTRGALQPQQVVRALAGTIAEVRGAARVEASADWSPGSLDVSARVNIEELDFQTPVGRVVGLRTDFTIDDLAGLRTSEPQEVTLDEFDPGVPLQNGRFLIDLRGDVAVIESAAFPFAGGVLQLQPVEWIFGDQDHRVSLTARDVDLAEVLALRPTPGLTVTGVVHGALPVAIGERSILIDNARLSTSEPGVIRYVGAGTDSLADSGGEATQLAFGALRNFQYQSLNLIIDGDLNRPMTVRLEASGLNPDMEGPFRGRTINLNVPITADFGGLLRQAAGIRDATEIIRDAQNQDEDG